MRIWNFVTVEMLVFFAIAAGVVIAFAADRIRRRRIIEEKVNIYHSALGSVRKTRMKYSSLMSEVASLRKQLDQYDVELLEIKKRVLSAQQNARDALDEIREKQEEAKYKLDMKVIEQQKINFEQEWKVLDSFKHEYVGSMNNKKELQIKYDNTVTEEQEAGERWLEEKNSVINTYKSLVREVPDLVYPEL